MDISAMMATVSGLLSGHGRDAAMLVGGAILSNPITCAQLVFMGATKIPGVGSWISRNPDTVKSWFDGFDKAIDVCVDKYAAQQAAGGATDAPKVLPAADGGAQPQAGAAAPQK